MRPNVYNFTAPGSKVIPLDARRNPPNTSIAVVIQPAATAAYSVQATYDNVLDAAVLAAGVTWWPVSAGFTGASASAVAALNYPVAALKFTVTAATGLGVTITVLQAGDGP